MPGRIIYYRDVDGGRAGGRASVEFGVSTRRQSNIWAQAATRMRYANEVVPIVRLSPDSRSVRMPYILGKQIVHVATDRTRSRYKRGQQMRSADSNIPIRRLNSRQPIIVSVKLKVICLQFFFFLACIVSFFRLLFFVAAIAI